jgi:hypothetical protein
VNNVGVTKSIVPAMFAPLVRSKTLAREAQIARVGGELLNPIDFDSREYDSGLF